MAHKHGKGIYCFSPVGLFLTKALEEIIAMRQKLFLALTTCVLLVLTSCVGGTGKVSLSEEDLEEMGRLGKDGFVDVYKNVFVLDGKPFKLFGSNHNNATYPWSWIFAGDNFEKVKHEVDKEMQIAKDLGMNVLRFFISWNHPIEEPEKVVDILREYLDMAEKHGLKIMPVVFHWAPREIYEELHIIDAYLDIIIPPFKDNTTVMAWDIANEPPLFKTLEQEEPDEVYVRWLQHTAARVRELDPNHLITVGVGGFGSNDLQSAKANKVVVDLVDFLCMHYYYYPEEFVKAYNMVKEVSDGKPIIVQEFCYNAAGGPEEEKNQASVYKKLWDNMLKADLAGVLNWQLIDLSSEQLTTNVYERTNAIVRTDYSVKPSGEVMKEYGQKFLGNE